MSFLFLPLRRPPTLSLLLRLPVVSHRFSFSTLSGAYEDWSKEDLIAKLRSLQPEDETQVVSAENSETQTSENATDRRKSFETNFPSSSPIRSVSQKEKTGQREIDHTKFAVRKIALRVAYYGWPYHGFAVDPAVPTVEGVLYDSLVRTKLVANPSDCDFSLCGRTDRGVSGLGQVVALKVRSALPKNHPDVLEFNKTTDTESTYEKIEREEENQQVSKQASDTTATVDATNELHYVRMLNNVLPDTIRVLAWAPVHENFSARFNCDSRTYKYFFTKELLDIDLMKDAASRLVGQHDFRNFCKLDNNGSNITFFRQVVSIDIRPVTHFQASNSEEQMFQLVLCGSAFLYHQVRCIMAVLFMVGQRHEKPDIVDRLLDVDEMPTKPVYHLANEIPLALYAAEYKDTLDWRYTGMKDDPHSLLTLTHMRSHLKEQWQNHTIKAALFREGMAILDDFKIPLPVSDSTTTDGMILTTYSDAVGKIRQSLMLPSQKCKNQKDNTPMERALKAVDDRSRLVLGGGTTGSVGKSFVPLEKRPRTESYIDKAAKIRAKNKEKTASKRAVSGLQNAEKEDIES